MGPTWCWEQFSGFNSAGVARTTLEIQPFTPENQIFLFLCGLEICARSPLICKLQQCCCALLCSSTNGILGWHTKLRFLTFIATWCDQHHLLQMIYHWIQWTNDEQKNPSIPQLNGREVLLSWKTENGSWTLIKISGDRNVFCSWFEM